MSAVEQRTGRSRGLRSAVGRLTEVGAGTERTWDPTSRLGLALLAAGMIAYLGIKYDNFLTVDNGFTILLNITSIGIAGFGTALLLISGNVDLSIGGQYALVSVSAGLVAQKQHNSWLAIAVALGLGAALGFLNGQLVRILRINPLIVTLGTAAVFHGVAYVVTDAKSSYGFPDTFTWVGRTKIVSIPLPVIFLGAVLLVGGFLLLRTVIGLRVFAVGGNPASANLSGVSSDRVVGTMYTINGLLIGLVAFLTISRLGSASPSLGTNFELDVLTAVILGGVAFQGGGGHPIGVLVGVVTIGVLNAGIIFAGVPDFWQQIVRGGVLLLALAGDQWAVRRRAKARQPGAGARVARVADAEPDESVEVTRQRRSSQEPPVVVVQNLKKSYGSVVAVADVSFAVRPGEILCLLGDNGAGKSTVIKMLSGAVTPDAGTITVGEKEVQLTSPQAARSLGIQTAYQDLALCPNLGAMYNLVLGAEPRRTSLGWLSIRDDRKALNVAKGRLGDLGIVLDDYNRPVHLLSGGQRQSIAIARVASEDARVVILDEPTAALGVRQTRSVLALVRKLASRGCAVVLISHDINTVFEIADRVVVLRLGRVIFEGLTDEVTPVQLIHLMAGLEDASSVPGSMTSTSKAAL